MLTKQSIKKNLKKWGYTTHSESIDEFLNKKLEKFVKKEVVQNGGRIVLPSEYWGVNSGRYSADASLGTDMQVTNSYIRPAIETSDPTGAIVGGKARKFEISERVFSEVLKEQNCKLCSAHKKILKEKFAEEVTSALNRASTKGGSHLSLNALKTNL